LLQAWGDIAIVFISLLSSLYPQASSPAAAATAVSAAAAAGDAAATAAVASAPLKHALFSLFSRAIDVR